MALENIHSEHAKNTPKDHPGTALTSGRSSVKFRLGRRYVDVTPSENRIEFSLVEALKRCLYTTTSTGRGRTSSTMSVFHVSRTRTLLDAPVGATTCSPFLSRGRLLAREVCELYTLLAVLLYG